MTPAAVGIRCPDHAGKPRALSPRRVSAPRIVRRSSMGTEALVTKTLIGINVAIYLVTAAQGAGINAPGGQLFDKMLLYGPAVANGDWWRLITAAFLHASLLHIGFNMLALWWFGAPVEAYLGRARFIGVYLVSGLAGSAGALVLTPHAVTVGASGAIFGILGAMLILEWQHTGRFGGQAATLIAINLVLNFAYNGAGGNISIGAHIGGLIGGILCTFALAHWGRGSAAYGRLGAVGIAGLVLVAAVSIAISYWQVRGLA
jgi:membrane associated rhomboid family serine protease